MLRALRQAFAGLNHPNNVSLTKKHTPGRLQTLRDEGWDGVQGTHHQEKYRRLEKLQGRLGETRGQIRELRKDRNGQHPGSVKWSHLNRRMKQFKRHAKQLEERIERQEKKIGAAEAS